MKNVLLALLALIIVVLVVYFVMRGNTEVVEAPAETEEPAVVVDTEETEDEPEVTEEETAREAVETIGESAGGADIEAYHFGDGDQEVLFVGGIHGGYSFNTAALAFEMIDYLEANPSAVPDNITATIIPVVNPDGLEVITDSTGRFDSSTVTDNDEARVDGRFNANSVDINRNFDCEWSAEGTWQDRKVSGEDAPFSESESQAVRDYVLTNQPVAMVAYFSQAGGRVYSSSCNNGVSSDTASLTNVYADAAGYGAFEEFNFYEITGDMVNWAAGEGIPAISVLLTDHENTEWSKNRAGMEAVLEYFAN